MPITARADYFPIPNRCPEEQGIRRGDYAICPFVRSKSGRYSAGGYGKAEPARCPVDRPLDLVLRRDGSATLVQQLVEQVGAAIAAGRLPPGSRLPAEPELARQLGISRGTVNAAWAQLARAGLLDRRPGRGTLVASTPAGPPRAQPEDRAERLLQLQAELQQQVDRLEQLQQRLAGQLFLLQRQRRWTQRLLRERAARRGVPLRPRDGWRVRRSS